MNDDQFVVIGKVDEDGNWQLLKEDTKVNCMAFVFDYYAELNAHYLEIATLTATDFKGMGSKKTTIH